MRAITFQNLGFVLCLYLVTGLHAQQTQRTTTATAVPRLFRFGGSFHPANGAPLAGVASVTFTVYREQLGGTPLWREIQNVELDQEAHYTVLIGSTENEGLPLDLFASGESRWLGVRFNVPGEVEQPRVLLVSVPYALKASDADTLGGRPASDYALAASPIPAKIVRDSTASQPAASTPTDAAAAAPSASSGSPNYIAKFTNSTDVVNSVMYESSGRVGINTPNPGLSGLTIALPDGTTAILTNNNSGTPRFALNNNSNGSWTMYDFSAGAYTAGITQQSGNVKVAGIVESAGGFKFPDGTMQSTAASSGPTGVTSLNNLHGNVTLSAGNNVTITSTGNGLAISAPSPQRFSVCVSVTENARCNCVNLVASQIVSGGGSCTTSGVANACTAFSRVADTGFCNPCRPAASGACCVCE